MQAGEQAKDSTEIERRGQLQKLDSNGSLFNLSTINPHYQNVNVYPQVINEALTTGIQDNATAKR